MGTGAVGLVTNGSARALTYVEMLEAAQTWGREAYKLTRDKLTIA